jgi:hypothetical protein
MTSPLRVLFAVLWWLQVIGCIAGAYFWVRHVRHNYLTELLRSLARQLHAARHNLDVPTGFPDLWSYLLNAGLGVFAIVVVLIGIPILGGRIITGRWRLGPRW